MDKGRMLFKGYVGVLFVVICQQCMQFDQDMSKCLKSMCHYLFYGTNLVVLNI